MFRTSLAVLAFALFCGAAKPKFESDVVRTTTPGYAVDVKADIAGAKSLYLVVTDAGDSFACDWADWIEPKLVGPNGEKKLTDLKWKNATAGWGKVNVGKNANGDPLHVAGKRVEGIGTHANSVIEYELPAGYTTFVAKGGLDDGGTNQNGGTSTSVRFAVYTEKPSITGGAVDAGKPRTGRCSRWHRRRRRSRDDALRRRADAEEPHQHRHRSPRPHLGLRSRQLSPVRNTDSPERLKATAS